MGIESTKELRSATFHLTGGINELAAVTEVPFNSFLYLNNWRISQDGKRIEKRNGVSAIDANVATSLGGHDVFGYHTYYNSTPAFCQAAIAEDKVYRKEGAGSWSLIKTWASTLTHPVRMLDIQDMQFCITENENFKILSTAAAAVVGVGIAAPTTVPTFTAAYLATHLNADCSSLTGWTDIDTGNGASTQGTYDSRSTFRFLNTGVAGDMAGLTYTLTEIGAEAGLEITIYPNTLGTYQNEDHIEIDIFNGRIQARIRIDKNDVYVYSGKTWVSCAVPVYQDKWQTFKFYINTKEEGEEYVEIFKDGIPYGSYYSKYKSTLTPGLVRIRVYGSATATDVYFDSIIVGGISGGNIVGLVRYAVTYVRGGTYTHESNPIVGLVGDEAFTGTGLDDMDSGGTYTGSKTKTFRVKISTAAATDKIDWSEDDGQTWDSTDIPLTTTVYLPYGIELTFAATTGHTLNDYWAFTCTAMSVDALHQKVTLSSIPVSPDAQVTQRWIYRTTSGGVNYYLLAIINDNTTTTYVDNIDQSTLIYGGAMRTDRDVPPKGKFSIWWDDRLWIGVDTENMIYYSDVEEPESFYLAERFISVRSGEAQDKLTGLIAYKGDLYFFKQNSIGIIRKRDDGTYARFWLCRDFGCIAPFTLQDCGGLLMFLSARGWEVFNGCVSYNTVFSQPIRATLDTIDKQSAKLDLICACSNRPYYEAWLSIPDRTTGSAVVVVVNYTTGAFYTFSYPKTSSYVGEARDSTKNLKTFIGTRDGYIGLADDGTDDFGTAITATARSPWIRFPKKYHVRKAEYEVEVPSSMALTIDFYVNMEQAAAASRTISGSTPTGTDVSYRYPIFDFEELDLRAQYFSMKLTNAEAVGSTLKINQLTLLYHSDTMKNRIVGN